MFNHRFEMTDKVRDNEVPVAPNQPARKVSFALGVGVFLMPIVFVWLLLKTGYSTKARMIGCAWLGLCGVVLLLTAPANPVAPGPPRAQTNSAPQSVKARAVPLSNSPAGSSPLEFKLGETRAIYRTLRTPVTLTNNTGSELAYAEVSCSFYDAEGKLLGKGLGNWVTVKDGEMVSGDVVASGIDLAKVSRQECGVRSR